MIRCGPAVVLSKPVARCAAKKRSAEYQANPPGPVYRVHRPAMEPTPALAVSSRWAYRYIGASGKNFLLINPFGTSVGKCGRPATRGKTRQEMARVLLVEDEMLVRELAFEDLSDAGHEVTVAGSGDEALATLRDDQGFDVLFTDIRMPGKIDGWQLADEARALIPGIRIVFATGLNDDTGWKKPEDRMLSKPYRRDDLLKALA